jgi:hypothetical protein
MNMISGAVYVMRAIGGGAEKLRSKTYKKFKRGGARATEKGIDITRDQQSLGLQGEQDRTSYGQRRGLDV